MNTRKILSIALRCAAISLLAFSTMANDKCKAYAEAKALKKAQKKAGEVVAGVSPTFIGAHGYQQVAERELPAILDKWHATGRFDPNDINTYPGGGNTPADPYAGIKNPRDRSRLNDLDRRIADPRNADVRDNLIRKRDRLLNDYPSFNPGRSTAQSTAQNTGRRTATGMRPTHTHTGAPKPPPPPVHHHHH